MEALRPLTNLFKDKFYQTHSSEIFTESRCLFHEHAVSNFLASTLGSLGYYQTGTLGRQWVRFNHPIWLHPLWERQTKKHFYTARQQAAVSFADSFKLCGDSLQKPERWFSRNTVVITDNHALFEPEYTICQVPTSYFGSFNYIPKNQNFKPQRRFSFSVNRFDSQRQLILFELLRQAGGIEGVLELDYVNFNVWNPYGNNKTVFDLQQSFAKSWAQSKVQHPQYQEFYQPALNALPIRNHDLSFEQVHVSAFLNLVVETYFENEVIALSEKIFRALVTPAPWIVYAARGTVDYLKSMGFDVLDDLVDHSYNKIPYEFSHTNNTKLIEYISSGLTNYENLQNQPLDTLTARCQQAAIHNQQLLAKMQKQWPADFAAWLPGVISKLDNS